MFPIIIPMYIFMWNYIYTATLRICRVYGRLSHEGRRPMGGMPSVRVFLRDPSPYLCEFRRKSRKIPNGKVDKRDRESNPVPHGYQFWVQNRYATDGTASSWALQLSGSSYFNAIYIWLVNGLRIYCYIYLTHISSFILKVMISALKQGSSKFCVFRT